MKSAIKRFIVLGLVVSAAAASNAITFSNISITGTSALTAGSSWAIDNKIIDFFLPNNVVGDVVSPLRFGTIVIRYEAKSNSDAIILDRLILSGLGAVAGTGTIIFNEVVEDLENPANGELASFGKTITKNSDLPIVWDLKFKNPSNYIRVKKTIVMSASDNANFAGDLASMPLVEQNLVCVPEPGSYIALAAGAALLASRRRRAA